MRVWEGLSEDFQFIEPVGTTRCYMARYYYLPAKELPMDRLFVRTNVWRLNRSFGHELDAKAYIKFIRGMIKDFRVFRNGLEVRLY